METLVEYMIRHLNEYRAMNPEIVLPVQNMFPDCSKYKKCCVEIPSEKMDKMREEINLSHRVFKVEKIKLVPVDKPDGFEDIGVANLGY